MRGHRGVVNGARRLLHKVEQAQPKPMDYKLEETEDTVIVRFDLHDPHIHFKYTPPLNLRR